MSNSTEDTMFLEPPTADSFLGERLQTDEIDQTRALIATLKAKVKADYTVGKATARCTSQGARMCPCDPKYRRRAAV